jgi:Tfp pilus tip-associated adhesin PilY1
VDDTQSVSNGTTSSAARTDTDTWGDQETSTAAREDTEGRASYTDTSTDAQHSDSSSTQQYTDTSTDAQHTDTRSTNAKQDKQTIKAYVDTERHTKHIIISPEKYFAIEKELAEIGVYDLMKDAVKETMLLCVWEGGYIW